MQNTKDEYHVIAAPSRIVAVSVDRAKACRVCDDLGKGYFVWSMKSTMIVHRAGDKPDNGIERVSRQML